MNRPVSRESLAREPRPAIGATWRGDRTTFRVWSPDAGGMEVELVDAEGRPAAGRLRLAREADGYFAADCAEAPPGTLYRYWADDRGPFPDPASRYQPRGVHGPSQVIDPAAFRWTDGAWQGVPLDDLVLYELHVGTFTPEGTFRALHARLPDLRELGVTAVELMPVADFAGNRNWGYDGVAPFAPARCYGSPDDLRAVVDEAHRLGLAVHLDVVYNHFGPDGAYQGALSQAYFSRAHTSPWGAGINFDGPGSEPVRAYMVENALRWIQEYHLDGLRLDATHAIVDESRRHILAEIADEVHQALAGRPVVLIAEDARNVDRLIQPKASGGYGLDGVWSDDFHHQLRRALAGDRDGYFKDFDGSTAALALTAKQGWYYRGQYSEHFRGPRGTDPSGIPSARFVFFVQNHDQIGNRAFGDRLHHVIDSAAYRAASVLLLILPETPLLFMGQEWAASTPFRYFTDHTEALGQAVTTGRREEFRGFTAFADPASRDAIPDPQALETFEASRLDWRERLREPHASVVRLYRRLLTLRREAPALRGEVRSGQPEIVAWDEDVLLVRRVGEDGSVLLGVIRLRGEGAVDLRSSEPARLKPGERWAAVLSTEEPEVAPDPLPIELDLGVPVIGFKRPGAVVLVAEPGEILP